MEKKIDLSDYQSKNNVGYCITKTAQYLKFSALATLKNVNVNDPLTLDQYGVLFALLQNNGIYQRQLGSVLLKDRPNTTRLVNILEEKNILKDEKIRKINVNIDCILHKRVKRKLTI